MKSYIYRGSLTTITLRRKSGEKNGRPIFESFEKTLVPGETYDDLPESSDFVSSMFRRGLLEEPKAEEAAPAAPAAAPPPAAPAKAPPSSKKAPTSKKTATPDAPPKTQRARAGGVASESKVTK